eukprot:TRINITY_DN11088_c0_g1_i1.p1 TRINITY_DN11088_c0_g1~~TRINITY_DN11088_c0_g1_i1.p1  ORF type:complete len:725 (-),score=121.67 TRINITY_DN11088_c0_g1_i1:197-2371(-)
MFWMGDQIDPSDQGDGKKKPARKRYDIPKTASCHVCGDLAAEHLHYGGIACYSCRAFFRRTVNSNRPILECSNDLNCKINKDTRKRCQFCRFEKCKAVGMKTSWVLTEEDKSKLAMRRTTSSPGGRPNESLINIKKEDPHEIGQSLSAPSSEEGITVKQRHASSPMSPPVNESSPLSTSSPYKASPVFFPGVSDQQPSPNPFFQNHPRPFLPNFGMPEGCQTSQSQPFYRPPYNHHPHHGEYNPFQNLFMKQNNEDKTQQSSLFPLNINKMHVSLSGSSDGVSLTIETHQGQNKNQQNPPTRNSTETSQNKLEQDFINNGARNRWSTQDNENEPKDSTSSQYNAMSPNALSPPSWNSGTSEQIAKRQKRHHQQSRTIFRCVSSENVERDCDSRSTIASPFSDSSGSQLQQDFSSNQNGNPSMFGPQLLDDAYSLDQMRSDQEQTDGHQGGPHDKVKPQVWKLTENSLMDPSPLPQLNTFTLQETLFVEQLTAIDERVRYQVPMEVSHGRSFLDCSVSGNHISQITIMHAYQTCIKRIVRFANSLQDFVELPPDDMQKLLVSNTVSIINIRIARWFHPKTDLKTQMSLCGTGQELFKDAMQEGKLSEGTPLKVGYDDVFSSPWCCDSSHEDRYETLISQIHQLDLDSTVVVLLSVMCLFDSEQVEDLSAKSTIISHGRKFSLLLQRYLVESIGKEKTAECFVKYREALQKLREMAEILINKRLIC